MINPPSTILLTATITPPSGMPGSVRNDPAARRAEYETAFLHYLNIDDKLADQIVILENSGADLSRFRDIHTNNKSHKRIHLINVSSEYDSSRGKGYGEFLMIDRGLEILKGLEAIQPNTPIWKITGRLIVNNFHKILSTSPKNWGLYCDMRGIPLIGARVAWNEWLELRLIAFTPNAYDVAFRDRFADGYVLERNFYHTVKELISKKKLNIRPRFKIQPDFAGHSGWSGKSYQSLSYKIKGHARATLRRLAPFIWI